MMPSCGVMRRLVSTLVRYDSAHCLPRICLLLTAVICFILRCESISCLQCATLRDEGCDDGTLAAAECSANNSHCITYVGTVHGRNIVFRDCVDKLLDECSVETFTDQQISVKVCYKSCSVDACNNKPVSASSRASRTFAGSVPSLTMLIVAYITCARQSYML